ncbi:MAG TPA: hypothetical protein VGK90_06530 [Rhizomicrobium sp.]
MFERVPDRPFEWIRPPEADFLEISDWGIDDNITNEIVKDLGAQFSVQSIAIAHQDFDAWTYTSLARRIRRLPIPETPVDAYLLVLRDWRHDSIGNTAHELGGLGLYRRTIRPESSQLGVFVSYRLVLLNPDDGRLIASVPALLPDGRLPSLPAGDSLWPPTSNDLTDIQRRELLEDFTTLTHSTLPLALRKLGLVPVALPAHRSRR